MEQVYKLSRNEGIKLSNHAKSVYAKSVFRNPPLQQNITSSHPFTYMEQSRYKINGIHLQIHMFQFHHSSRSK